MHIQVLGSAAGGGFPQWNCNCHNCNGSRTGVIKAAPRTQSSIAVSDDGENWILCNASPDIRAQLASFPALQPARALRDTAIGDIILLDSQIDHVTGLLTLREGCPHRVWCTDLVHEDLTSGFPLFKMLSFWDGGGLLHQPIKLDGEPFVIPTCPNLSFVAIDIRSNAPPYSPHRDKPRSGNNIALLITDTRTGATLLYAPGLGEIDEQILTAMEQADCMMVDGTVWRDDEMAFYGVGDKTGRQMGHLPQSGEGGMLEALAGFPDRRRILIHINNTNPILNEESPERAKVEAAGIEVAFDGMGIHLEEPVR